MPALDALLLLTALTPFASALAAPQAQPSLPESQQQNVTSAISTAFPSPVLAHTATAWIPEDASKHIPTSTPFSTTTISYGPTTSPTGPISGIAETAVVEITDSSFDVPTSTLVAPGQQASDKPGKGGDRPAYGPPAEASQGSDQGESGDQGEEIEPAGADQHSATEPHKGGDRPAYGPSGSDESTDDDSSWDGDDASSETGGDDQDSASDDGSERPAYGPPTTSTPPPSAGSDEPSSTYTSQLTLATSVSGTMTLFAAVTAISQTSFDKPVWTTSLPTAGETGADGVVTTIETTLVALPTAHSAQSGQGQGLGRPNYAPADGEASTPGSNSTAAATSAPASLSPSGGAVASANGTDASFPTMSTGTGSHASVTPFPSANGTVTASSGSMGTGSMTMSTSTRSADLGSAEPSLNRAAQTQTQSLDAGAVAMGNGLGFGAVAVGLLGMLV